MTRTAPRATTDTQVTCTTRRRPWPLPWSSSRSARCWPATSACRTALGGSNRIEAFLEPSFHPAAFSHASAPGRSGGRGRSCRHRSTAPAWPGMRRRSTPRRATARPRRTARSHDEARPGDSWSGRLMAVSIALAFAGIGVATLFFKSQPERADADGGGVLRAARAAVEQVLRGRSLRRRHRAADQGDLGEVSCGRRWTPA